MSVVIEVSNNLFHIDLPDNCPLCHAYMSPKIHTQDIIVNDNEERAYLVVFFSCSKCANTFAGSYEVIKNNTSSRNCNTFIRYYTPSNPITKLFSDEIIRISPSFTETYRQAEVAETHGLTQLAGMGYRKALEQIIKDCLVSLEVAKEHEVMEITLAKAIELFADNPKLQKAAHSARVIGNEYAHYYARYEGYDLLDLKKMLDLSVYWLEMEILSRQENPYKRKPAQMDQPQL